MIKERGHRQLTFNNLVIIDVVASCGRLAGPLAQAVGRICRRRASGLVLVALSLKGALCGRRGGAR